MTFNIVSDSCCDLGKELASERNIHIVPLNVLMNDKTYRDGIDITNDLLFQMVQETGTLPKTSAPTIASFLEVLTPLSGDILFIGIGSKFSATCQNAGLAAQEVNGRRMEIIDSQNLSTGIGLLALLAADLRDAGKSFEETIAGVKAAIPRVRTIFTIDQMDFLHKGGRCSTMQMVMGSLLKIHPIIEVRQDGTMGVKGKRSGSYKKGLDFILDSFKADAANVDLKRAFFPNTTGPEDLDYMHKGVLEIAPIEDLRAATTGSVVACHCGPRTTGLSYLLKG